MFAATAYVLFILKCTNLASSHNIYYPICIRHVGFYVMTK
ncbi:hypothetical protein GLYMA_12G095950v4 [Glycine max]|nr:hypothetical protein GLYMA_12G095950v4 [Glycine max]KAH1142419.1 hypothetical protein GYH30_033212 [Glycine max]